SPRQVQAIHIVPRTRLRAGGKMSRGTIGGRSSTCVTYEAATFGQLDTNQSENVKRPTALHSQKTRQTFDALMPASPRAWKLLSQPKTTPRSVACRLQTTPAAPARSN